MLKALTKKIRSLLRKKTAEKEPVKKQEQKFPGKPEQTKSKKQHSKHGNKNRNRNRNKNKIHKQHDGPGNDVHHPIHVKKPIKLPELVEVEPQEGKTRFSDLDVAKEVLAGFQDLKFKYCTPIQEKCIPEVLKGQDITGKAQTGTGKTAAFLTSIFTYLLKNPIHKRKDGSCRALVLAPTRELAIQIHKDAEAIGKYCNLNSVVVFGGMDHQKQRKKLNRPVDILIGTPGRILDFIRSRNLHFDKTEVLVIDEADRMLDMGFIPDVSKIVSRLPHKEKRQTLFFSATLTGDVSRLIDRWLENPICIETEPEQMVTDLIEQKFYSVLKEQKYELLQWIIKNDKVERALIFVNRKTFAESLTKRLRKSQIRCDFLSGDVAQKKRLKILEDFKSGKINVIVATDVAARGIHVEGVTHVFNYDIPYRPEEYVHRIGRTGRAGIKGTAVSFVCEYGAYSMPEIEEFLGEPITCVQPEEDMLK